MGKNHARLFRNVFIRMDFQRTANSPHGVSGKGAPRHVEETNSYARGDVRAKNVEEKDASDLLPKDVTATNSAALVSDVRTSSHSVRIITNVMVVCLTYQRMAHLASGVGGANVPRAAEEALSPVAESARVKLVEERVVIPKSLCMRVAHAGRSAAQVCSRAQMELL